MSSSTLDLRARSAENRKLSRELVVECRQTMNRSQTLLEQLRAIRAEIGKTLGKKPSAPFAWLANKDFSELSPSRKQAYLTELADHLDKERAASAHGAALPRTNVFLSAHQ